MKILLLPNNIGSMTGITVKALNDAGHEAKGLMLGGDIKQNSRNLRIIEYNKNKQFRFLNFIQWYFLFLKELTWADVVHWNGSFNFSLLKITLPIIKLFKNKAAIVEFVGSDIRIPDVEFNDNIYYRNVFAKGYEYAYESRDIAESNLGAFSKAGFGVLALPGMDQYIPAGMFKNKVNLLQRIIADDFIPSYPHPLKIKPVIVHIPSAPIAKGTPYVNNAIEQLKAKYDFEYKLIQNMPHSEAMKLVSECDIFIDQLILGSYGMATMEALSFGKPVLCYIKESVKKDFPEDCPVVNANPDNITEKLEMLLKDGNLRNQIGKKGRQYVVKYHDVKNTIKGLIDFYESIYKNPLI